MFYMVDKVSAAKKLAWLHFEYGNPPRDDGIYEPYFSRCDKVITVSPTVERALCEKLPSISERVLTIENINDKQLIWNMALQGKSFPDRVYTGTRLLSVIRICEQKGVDFIVPVLKQLRADGYELRWYILGGGDKSAVDALKVQAVNEGVADMLMLLGTTDNPYPYMRDCDIYVQPSRYEGKPITVEEAKILCRPIVACRYASADEQLERGRFGVVVDIGAEGLYGGIRRLLDDRSERERLSRELASCDFGNESEIDKFYDAVE